MPNPCSGDTFDIAKARERHGNEESLNLPFSGIKCFIPTESFEPVDCCYHEKCLSDHSTSFTANFSRNIA